MVPVAVPRIANLQYLRVLGEIDSACGESRARVDDPCRPGCDACCHGPFDIGTADAWLLIEGIASLDDEPRRRVLRRVAEHARAQRAALEVAEGTSPTVASVGEDAFDRMCEALAATPCPLLEQGRCLAYAFRPQPCRLVGAVFVGGDVELDMDCPIGLTQELAPVTLDVAAMEAAVGRIERRLELPVVGAERTTIAIAVDTVLRSPSAAPPGASRR